MGDVGTLVKRLSLPQSVAAKAAEYARLATARLGPGGLGQFELCKGAVCVELACMTLGQAVDSTLVARFSCVGEKVYRNAKAAMQKVLGVTSRATARDLCIQFGCARHDQSVRAALAAYKERFVRSLPPAQQARVDFGRPVFLAAAFYLVARKHKVQVDRMKLLGPLGVAATEFAQVCASMADLCADLCGEQRKRKAGELSDERAALIERTGAADDGDAASDSEDEVEDENDVGHRINAKKQRQREYEEWKSRMLAEEKNTCSSGGAKKAQQLTEKKLRQATLSFAAPAPEGAQAVTADAAAGGAAQGVAANGSKQPPKTQEAASCSKGKASGRKAAGTGKQKGKSNE
ncbi:hypothetical protein ABPG77_004797 [Micractinium sp. CCAP 211/92]